MTPAEQALIDAARDTEPLSGASVERWETLKAAARVVKEERAQLARGDHVQRSRALAERMGIEDKYSRLGNTE